MWLDISTWCLSCTGIKPWIKTIFRICAKCQRKKFIFIHGIHTSIINVTQDLGNVLCHNMNHGFRNCVVEEQKKPTSCMIQVGIPETRRVIKKLLLLDEWTGQNICNWFMIDILNSWLEISFEVFNICEYYLIHPLWYIVSYGFWSLQN